ncbi:TetR/AcrR family transcriptional regulator C-terminal domain-containing protein [Arthrobacter sp. H41]|uniref:TetR/AcrR family transcriptional regulator C-terminal domain-containing protein n=2 Tax=Arthrobacter sp. H41 TaxID=1312978 RepID=UPI0004B22A70
MSRDLVLAAALELVDDEGLNALSMRRLGHKLGKDPMALYRYAANRDALLDGLTELVLGQLNIPPVADWQDQLRRTAHDFRDLALRHPHVVPLLVTRPLSTPLGLRPPGALRPLEQLMALLTKAGFDSTGALHVYRAYYGFLLGHILNELEEFIVDPEEDESVLRHGLYRLPKSDFPHVRELAPLLADYDGKAELDQGPLLVTRPLSTPLGLRPPGALRPLEQVMALLTKAGFDSTGALHVYRVYYGFLIGHILNELEEFIVDAEEDESVLRHGLYRLPKNDFPHVRELAPLLADYDGKAELDQGLDILLAGLNLSLGDTADQ